METEQPGIPLAEEPLDTDIVVNGFPWAGQAAMEGDHRIQQAVDRKSFGDEVNPQVTGKEQIGLTGLHRNTGRNPVAIQVPGMGEDVMLGDHPAIGHGTGLTLYLDDPVNQHQRLIRQSDPGGEAVHLAEFRPQHPADLARGKLHAHLAIKGAGLFRFGRWRCNRLQRC